MDLMNRLPHMKNSSVLVNGTRYQIEGGIARGVKDADAQRLLANPAWAKVRDKPTRRAPVVEPESEPVEVEDPPEEEKPKARVKRRRGA